MKIMLSFERLNRPGNYADKHYRFRIDVTDDDGGEHYHCGQDASPARALSLAAYHWHRSELAPDGAYNAPLGRLRRLDTAARHRHLVGILRECHDMSKKDNLNMIKLHDSVFINPLNIISVNLGKDNVYVSMTNQHSHRFVPNDPRTLPDDFERIKKALKEQVDCVDIRHDIVVTVDAICSVAKVEIGIVVNLMNGSVEYIRCKSEDRDKIINRISKEVAQAA